MYNEVSNLVVDQKIKSFLRKRERHPLVKQNGSIHSNSFEQTLTSKYPTAQNPFHSNSLSIQTFVIEVVEGPHKGESLSLDKEVVLIGRAEWCDLQLLNDRWLSKHHCELHISSDEIRVKDLGSRNGIYLDELRVYDACFLPQTRLRVGESVLALNSSSEEKVLRIPYHDDSCRLVGQSSKMRNIFSYMERLGKQDVSTLLLGETGTGKTSIAQAIHEQSRRKDGPFVVVNCGALPASLIEASLFGYEKGAFTGAHQSHRGYFEQAHGGTLFLDEIGELPLHLQPLLLDVLERQQVRPLGSERMVDVDFRLLCATHRNLRGAIEQKLFREDLYYRLATIELEVPALRERIEDLPLLIQMFLCELAPERRITLDVDALEKLKDYLWPGNIRQLRNTIERALTFLEDDVIRVDDLYLHPVEETSLYTLPPSSQSSKQAQELVDTLTDETAPLKDLMEKVERLILQQTLQACDWKVPPAAEKLQISKVWLYNRIKKYDLPLPSKKERG